ncbi:MULTISPECIES: hypothetical protein [Corynebacterium]|uniref:hypothetical protein n=1 Tax=Corynebacterium TaxID=1716 RepID=UPI00254380E4|nr:MULTISPECIES: hypothetical protein [Corynebacterium]MDK4238549.1 hypothetical protein [Corynebacterium propinquum]MDK8845859.1 hypothetical protein [Corynebacterium sp. MSK297]
MSPWPHATSASFAADASHGAAIHEGAKHAFVQTRAARQRHESAVSNATATSLPKCENQMSLNLRTPAEEVAEAANVVRTMARNLREGREFL